MQRPERILKWKTADVFFFLALAVSFIPILFLDFIVTSDGPCHLYNSRILIGWLLDGQSAFYSPFLQLNQYFDPNWWTNMVQIPLLRICSAPVAERIFFSLYLITFSFGLRRLLLAIHPASGFLSVIGITFAWNAILMKGFTNNAWSVALWFWFLYFWLELLRENRKVNYFFSGLILLALYVAHPVGLVFALISGFCLLVGKAVFDKQQPGFIRIMRMIFIQSAKLFLLALVPLALLASFYLRRDWSAEGSGKPAKALFQDVLELNILQSMTSRESPWIASLAVILMGLFCAAVIMRVKRRKLLPEDGLMLALIAAFLLLLNPLGHISGGLELVFRLGLFPPLCALFWIATCEFPSWARQFIMVISWVIMTGLVTVRFPVQKNASDYAREIVSLSDSIQEKSTLLVLNYDWAGRTPEGEPIADRAWLFTHVDCYLGTYKDLVISDNYEANFWYFPMVERWQTNMYMQTDKDGINFDHRPPRADMNSYKRRTGQYIDYVLMLSYDDQYASHPYTREIWDQLQLEYKLVAVSPFERAKLFRRTIY